MSFQQCVPDLRGQAEMHCILLWVLEAVSGSANRKIGSHAVRYTSKTQILSAPPLIAETSIARRPNNLIAVHRRSRYGRRTSLTLWNAQMVCAYAANVRVSRTVQNERIRAACDTCFAARNFCFMQQKRTGRLDQLSKD